VETVARLDAGRIRLLHVYRSHARLVHNARVRRKDEMVIFCWIRPAIFAGEQLADMAVRVPGQRGIAPRRFEPHQ
jgi:hypothetical protein